MPEQASARALIITTAPFEQPFATEIYPYGVGGLNAKDANDLIPVGQFQILTNLTHNQDRRLTVRPTLVNLATAGTNHHSVRRLHNPRSTDTRFWGVDTSVYEGLSGALASVDSGYSGSPLSLIPHRPKLAADPWMFVADSQRMRKIRADGVVMPIGLPVPTSQPTVNLSGLDGAHIAAMDTSDGTQASTWTQVGFIPSGLLPTGPSFVFNAIPKDVLGQSGNAVEIDVTVANTSTAGFPEAILGIGRALVKNLSLFDSTATPVTDDDIFHCFLRISRPDLIDEVRLYLVCSGDFVLPASPMITSAQNGSWSFPGMGIGNFASSAYMLSWRPSDYQNAVLAQETLQSGADRVRTASFLETFADPVAAKTANSPNYENLAGSGVWAEFGNINVPITRRGDFVKIGTAGLPGTDWSTITGIYIAIKTIAYPQQYAAHIAVAIDDLRFAGGFGPDSSPPGQPYDYRITNYDPRTGAESNPTAIMSPGIDALRESIAVGPPAYGDANVRQRIYRRGGTLNTDWFFCGANTADGAVFVDALTDDTISTAGSVNIDNYQPVPTLDGNGNTVLAQPVPILFGPVQGILFALGDPNRPGFLYWCFPDLPDSWGAENNFEVCSSSEELMAGLVYGNQAYCFSRERLYVIYPSLTDTSVITVATTACRRGLVSRWAWAIGLGFIFGVAKDGIFATAGGVEEIISIQVQNLFRGKTWNGYSPVDFTVPNAIRLGVFEDTLYFCYQGTDGNRHVLFYSLLYKYWGAYDYAGKAIQYLLSDDDTALATLLAGAANGHAYSHDPAGTSDDGTAVTCIARGADWDLGRPREDKLLGDQFLDFDADGETLTLQNFLNNQTVTNAAVTVTSTPGRTRAILDVFGTTPQRARNITTDVRWTSASHRPTLYFFGQSIIPEPDLTVARVTQWDDLGHPDESYVTGVTFDCDTGGVPIIVFAERDFNQVVDTMSTLTVNTPGRRKIKFSWPAKQANKVRIRPEGDCNAWILYRADWISVPEPPRIAGWDIHFEADGDQYYTGLDLYCDTEGLEKQIQISVDGVVLTDIYTGEPFWRVTTSGRQWVHLTLPWGRGHVFHFVALDANPGLLYKHKWFLAPEPSEQANWNQNFTDDGTLADKWYKGCLFEVDTFGQNKNVTIEIDGVAQIVGPNGEAFLTVNTNGRRIVQLAFPQKLGRILRVWPTDGNRSRPYSIIPLFDTEPYKLTRWETQETDHDVPGFHVLIDAHVTLRSTKDVTLTLKTYLNQTGDAIVTDTYTIPSTDGIKDKRYVPFLARKGVLTKYVFTCPSDFHLFEEESEVLVLPWGSEQPMARHPFGNDDLDRTRNMVNAPDAAARSGGGS